MKKKERIKNIWCPRLDNVLDYFERLNRGHLFTLKWNFDVARMRRVASKIVEKIGNYDEKIEDYEEKEKDNN